MRYSGIWVVRATAVLIPAGDKAADSITTTAGEASRLVVRLAGRLLFRRKNLEDPVSGRPVSTA